MTDRIAVPAPTTTTLNDIKLLNECLAVVLTSHYDPALSLEALERLDSARLVHRFPVCNGIAYSVPESKQALGETAAKLTGKALFGCPDAWN